MSSTNLPHCAQSAFSFLQSIFSVSKVCLLSSTLKCFISLYLWTICPHSPVCPGQGPLFICCIEFQSCSTVTFGLKVRITVSSPGYQRTERESVKPWVGIWAEGHYHCGLHVLSSSCSDQEFGDPHQTDWNGPQSLNPPLVRTFCLLTTICQLHLKTSCFQSKNRVQELALPGSAAHSCPSHSPLLFAKWFYSRSKRRTTDTNLWILPAVWSHVSTGLDGRVIAPLHHPPPFQLKFPHPHSQ